MRLQYGLESKKILKLALPMIATQLSLASMGVIDTVMVGQIDATSLAAIGLATGLSFPIIVFIMGVMGSVSILNSYAYGEKNEKKIIHWTYQGFYLAVFLASVAAVFFFFNRDILSLIFHFFPSIAKDPRLFPLMSSYLSVLMFGVFGIALFCLCRSYLEPQNQTVIVFLSAISAVPMNITLNYALIYGEWGFPRMGVVGTAYATSFCNWYMFFALFFYIIFSKRFKGTSLIKRPEALNFKSFKQLLSLGLPIGFNIVIEVIVFAFFPFFLSSFGTNTIAAAQIFVNFSGLIYQIIFGFSSSYAIRIGNLMGAKEQGQVKKLLPFYLLFSFVVAFFNMFFIFLSAEKISHLYTNNSGVIEISFLFLMLSGVYQIPDCLQIGLGGMLRGFRDTRYPVFVMFVSYWFVGLPFGWIFSKGALGFPVLGAGAFVWGLCLGVSVAAILFYIRLRGYAKKLKTS